MSRRPTAETVEPPSRWDTPANKAARLADGAARSQGRRGETLQAEERRLKAELREMETNFRLARESRDARDADQIAKDYLPTDEELRRDLDEDRVAERRIELQRQAIEVAGERVRDQEAIHLAKKQEAALAAIPFVCELADRDIQQVRQILAGLEDALIGLITADLVRLDLVGDRFSVPQDVAPPIATGQLVHAFLKGIPPRLRPEDLDLEALMPQARRRATEIINNVKGKE